jgi:diguanylate cyclase (GGDEF)-like protein/PAS domain S-box-containing protein
VSFRPATIFLTLPPEPNVAGELLRMSMALGRLTWIGNLGLALLLVMTIWGSPQALAGLAWWIALGAVLLSRGLYCARQVARRELPAEAVHRNYALFAGVEGVLWAGGLVALPAVTPVGMLLQFGLSVAALVGSLLPYGAVPRAWLASVVPLGFAQLALLLTRELPMVLPLAFAWAICLAIAVFASLRMQRGVADNLRLRFQAQEAATQKELTLAELNHGRDQLRLALEAIDAGIADTNVVTGERFFSARYAEILGYTDRAAFMHAHRFSDALHDDDRARVLEARRRHIEEGVPFREEFRLRTARGDYVWVQARGESTRGADGRAARFVMSIVDVTARREAETRLIASERRYRALVEASPSLIWMCDHDGKLTFVSTRGSRGLYGYEPRHMLGRHVTAFNAPEFGRREFLRRFLPVYHGQPVYDIEATHLSRTGKAIHVTVSALPTLDGNGKVESVLGICTDITALKGRERELRVALRNQQVIFDAAGEGIAFVRDGAIESANGALAKMLGATREWLIGRQVREILARPGDWEDIRRVTHAAGQQGEAANHEVMMRAPDAATGGRTVWCQLTSRTVGDEGDVEATAKMILVLTDITTLKRREELAWHQANHDELTGLPNRRLLVENARRLLSVAMRRKRLAALMLLDLDGFKEVNDVFGHAHGDTLLRRVALRLSSVLREYDLVARTGGDEFVVLLPEIDEPQVANHVAEKLIAAAADNIEDTGRSVRIRASVGIALFPADGQDFDSLMVRADSAMYAAKAAGKNQYRLASPPAEPDAAGALH